MLNNGLGYLRVVSILQVSCIIFGISTPSTAWLELNCHKSVIIYDLRRIYRNIITYNLLFLYLLRLSVKFRCVISARQNIEVNFLHISFLERSELIKCVFIILQTEEAIVRLHRANLILNSDFYVTNSKWKNMALNVHFTEFLKLASEICFRPVRVNEISLKIKLQYRMENFSSNKLFRNVILGISLSL
jgi:hypothetical protein